MRKIHYICLPLLLLALTTCHTDINVDSPVPKCTVNFALNIMVDAPILNTQGGFYTVTSPMKYGQYIGYSGLLIVHGFDDKFYCYDLCCPTECKREIMIEPEIDGTAKCKECDTMYDIGFGSGMPQKGSSKYRLRKYRVIVSGYNITVQN